MKQIKLDETKLSQMLSDEAFFDTCTEYARLKNSALAAAGRWRSALRDEECSKCGALKNMRPVIRAFYSISLEVSEDGKAQVRDYLINRAKRDADRFVIQFRLDGAVHVVEF